MRKYTIFVDGGENTTVTAKSRTEAINKYLAETGMPLWFFKKHCLVRLAD